MRLTPGQRNLQFTINHIGVMYYSDYQEDVMGGVFPRSFYLYNSQYAKNICGY